MENNEQQKANHLASIHANVKEESTESIETSIDVTDEPVASEEILGETPEVLPTELGGIKLED